MSRICEQTQKQIKHTVDNIHMNDGNHCHKLMRLVKTNNIEYFPDAGLEDELSTNSPMMKNNGSSYVDEANAL